MKAYMLVDFDNPVSVRYSEIAIDSFKPVIQRGILDIIPTQCITPKTLPTVENDFNWQKSLATIDMKKGRETKPMHETEKAGMCSHWELMRRQRYEDRFFIMEHDAYLLDADDFEKAYEFMLEHDIAYANLGLFMSCYSYNKHSATWMYEQLIRENNVPVNCGPYLMAEKLYKLYAKHFLSKRNYLGKEYSFMIPFRDSDKLGYGRTEKEMFQTINFARETWRALSPYMNTPSTQCWSEELGLTQNHHNYKKAHHLHFFFKKL